MVLKVGPDAKGQQWVVSFGFALGDERHTCVERGVEVFPKVQFRADADAREVETVDLFRQRIVQRQEAAVAENIDPPLVGFVLAPARVLILWFMRTEQRWAVQFERA